MRQGICASHFVNLNAFEWSGKNKESQIRMEVGIGEMGKQQ